MSNIQDAIFEAKIALADQNLEAALTTRIPISKEQLKNVREVLQECWEMIGNQGHELEQLRGQSSDDSS